jgi:SAM-dependent methyltransferase
MNRPIQGHPDVLPLKTLETCPLCESSSLHLRFKVRHIVGDPLQNWALEQGFSTAPIVACRDCGFVFKSVQPDALYLDQHYTRLPGDYIERVAEEFTELREDYRVARKILTQSFPAGGSILDVGCSSGFFLHSLGKTWEKHGLEISHLAAMRARERGEIRVHECDIASAGFADESLDVVCSFDVVEHLSDPLTFFREARRILKPSGWLLLGTGNSGSACALLSGSRWAYFSIPEHVSFFSRHSLRLGLRKAGFLHTQYKRVHHGERRLTVATGWIRAVGKHWAITIFGEGVTHLRLFRQKTSEFPVPYFFDHMICIAKGKNTEPTKWWSGRNRPVRGEGKIESSRE